VGFNYHHQDFAAFPKNFPGQKFIGAEMVSALETHGYYDLIPSDSIRRWPVRWDIPFNAGNKDLTISPMTMYPRPGVLRMKKPGRK